MEEKANQTREVVMAAANALLCSRIDSEPCCYLCPFSRMMAMRRSVTGSKGGRSLFRYGG